jgi:hypothetical protein
MTPVTRSPIHPFRFGEKDVALCQIGSQRLSGANLSNAVICTKLGWGVLEAEAVEICPTPEGLPLYQLTTTSILVAGCRVYGLEPVVRLCLPE